MSTKPAASFKEIFNLRNGIALAALTFIGLSLFIKFLTTSETLMASDQVSSPAWKFYFESLGQGEIPLWNPWSLSGLPTFDALFGDASYPLFALSGFLFKPYTFIGWFFVIHTLIAGYGAYFLCRRYFSLNTALSVALACAYMLNTNFVSHVHAGHTAKYAVMALLPFVVFFLLRSLGPKPRWFHLVGLSLTVALTVSTSHLQMSYFVLIGLFVIWAFKCGEALMQKQFQAAGLLVARFWVPVLLGIGIMMPILWPPIQYNTAWSVRGESSRQTYEHATSWSMHPEELASLIVPEFCGVLEHYWGRNPFKLNSEYVGLPLLMLGLAGFYFCWRKGWGYATLSILSILFALGANTPAFRVFYHLVPGIKNFRAPSMVLFWLTLSLLIMSIHFFLALQNGDILKHAKGAEKKKRFLQFGFGFAGLVLILGLAAEPFYGMWVQLFSLESAQNLSQMQGAVGPFRMGAIRSALFIALTVFVIHQFGFKDYRPLALGLSLAALIVVDLYIVDSHFIKTYDSRAYFNTEPAVAHLQRENQEKPLRVFGMPGTYQRGFMQYHEIRSVEGFTDQEFRLYRNFRGNDYSQNPYFVENLKQSPDGHVYGSHFLDLLNVAYLAYRVREYPGIQLAPNRTNLGPERVVSRWQKADSATALRLLRDTTHSPKAMTLLHAEGPSPSFASPDSGAPVFQVSKRDLHYNHQTYEVTSDAPGIFIVSELWFPFWQVKVNDKPAELLRADYILRAAEIPQGKSKVEFHYVSPWIRFGLQMSLLSLVILGLFAALHRWRLEEKRE